MNFRLILPIIFFMATSGLVQAQITTTDPTTEIESKNEVYTLKGIVVDGVKKYTPEQILRFTGLQKGEKIEIPGQKISNAIKKLWDTNSFSKVEIYVDSVDGDQVVLSFALQDLK